MKPQQALAPKRYRPSLTSAQIQHILALAKSESPLSSISIELIAYLTPFHAKIEVGTIQHNPVSMQARPGIMEKLGAPAPAPAASNQHTQHHPHIDSTDNSHCEAEAHNLSCYERYRLNPADLTLREIEQAEEYAYLNDLFSPEENAAFEERAAKLAAEAGALLPSIPSSK